MDILYKELKAGDTRKRGDQVRARNKPQPFKRHRYSTDPDLPGQWENVRLIGHEILQSDLINGEFRRPII